MHSSYCSMNPRGLSPILTIFEMLVVLFVIFLFVFIAKGYANDETILKINLAEDIVLMVNTLAAVPGDAAAEYPGNSSKYNIILDSSTVLIFQHDEPEINHVSRKFILPQGYVATGLLEEKERLCLEKQNKTILMRGCKNNEFPR